MILEAAVCLHKSPKAIEASGCVLFVTARECGNSHAPACLQENTVVQTCVVACYSLSFAGGFGCYLLSMDSQTYDNLGPIAGNRQQVTPEAMSGSVWETGKEEGKTLSSSFCFLQ